MIPPRLSTWAHRPTWYRVPTYARRAPSHWPTEHTDADRATTVSVGVGPPYLSTAPVAPEPRRATVTTVRRATMATVENHGTIVLVRPDDDFEKEWLEEHTDGTWWGGALVVEPRYVEPLLAGLYGYDEE